MSSPASLYGAISYIHLITECKFSVSSVFVRFPEGLHRVFPKPPPPDQVLAKHDKGATENQVGAEY